MKILCVAEKPSISRSISQILSGGQLTNRTTACKFIRNYDFAYPQRTAHFTVTCVAGHLTAQDFVSSHRKWTSCQPIELFEAGVDTFIPDDKKAIEKNLLAEARSADVVMIWTDCDREGEYIGWEIVSVCKRAKRNIKVERARFSAIIARDIHHAAQNPVPLDQAQVDAVAARTVLDLKIGAAFTRMQTLTLQRHIPVISDNSRVISYGSCQFPTLGFVVNRFKQVKSFVPEDFSYIHLTIKAPGSNEETPFTWRRGHIFDRDVAVALYQSVMRDTLTQVTKVVKKTTKKWKPLPLTTVELQKAGSRLLRLAPKKVLDIAEKLYQQGFVSYPRTETDQFPNNQDFNALIEKQKADGVWGAFATKLVDQGGFERPRKGKHNDNAHPPIHPTAHANNLNGDEKRVYEFITRRFLACCSKDAEGFQTIIDVMCGGEAFHTNGLLVLERNYLEVYIYDKWNGHAVPEFQEGDQFQPARIELLTGTTTGPNYLTEADLVTLMDKNGIGTDATIAQHIDTVVQREYVIEEMSGNTKYLKPSTLGMGLVEGYDQIGLEKCLTKPQLRRATERSMKQVCDGLKTKEQFIEEDLAMYKEMFQVSEQEVNKLITAGAAEVAMAVVDQPAVEVELAAALVADAVDAEEE
ncbi:DNA topoisomerase [Schizophyllum amplum]|uniref:DNA topoisomerase n=1 Tax=Schizophyllum amplum TaxID=97359 RepID=A0A550CKA3_9AGAR|nr:DNA topoisomerase [Auriculariopsis ampla]